MIWQTEEHICPRGRKISLYLAHIGNFYISLEKLVIQNPTKMFIQFYQTYTFCCAFIPIFILNFSYVEQSLRLILMGELPIFQPAEIYTGQKIAIQTAKPYFVSGSNCPYSFNVG